MKINSDYKDRLRNLKEGRVRYLVVGGYAWMTYTAANQSTGLFGLHE